MREYKIHPANGIPTTIQLPDDEARKLGLAPLKEDDKPVETKQKAPANKARTPANKRAEIASKAWGAKKDAPIE